MNSKMLILFYSLIPIFSLFLLFSSCKKSIKQGPWNLTIISIIEPQGKDVFWDDKQPEAMLETEQQRIPNTLVIEFEITFSGDDSISVSPSDFAIVDNKGNRYKVRGLGSPTYEDSGVRRGEINYRIEVVHDFLLFPGENAQKSYLFSVPDSERSLKFQFKDLPAIHIER